MAEFIKYFSRQSEGSSGRAAPMEFPHCRRRFQSETYWLIKERTGGKDRRRYQVVLTEPEKCRNSSWQAEACPNLVRLRRYTKFHKTPAARPRRYPAQLCERVP